MFRDFLQLNDSGHLINIAGAGKPATVPKDYLISWVIRGKLISTINDSTGRILDVQVEAGDLLVLPPVVHVECGSRSKPAEFMWAYFNGKLAPYFYEQLKPAHGFRHHIGFSSTIRQIFEDVVLASFMMYQMRTSDRLHPHTCLCNLLGLLIDHLHVHTLDGTVERRHGSWLDMQHLDRFLYSRLNETITLEEMAAETDLSVSHFSRLFKKQIGVSPVQYLIQHRIQKACMLLSLTSVPIEQIGKRVGYDDPHYFSRIFKRVMKQTPTEYRLSTVRNPDVQEMP